MTETTPGETPVERRLRDEREEGCGCHRCESFGLGADAIGLLREHSAIATNAKWAAKRRALLARCEGDA